MKRDKCLINDMTLVPDQVRNDAPDQVRNDAPDQVRNDAPGQARNDEEGQPRRFLQSPKAVKKADKREQRGQARNDEGGLILKNNSLFQTVISTGARPKEGRNGEISLFFNIGINIPISKSNRFLHFVPKSWDSGRNDRKSIQYLYITTSYVFRHLKTLP